MKKLLLMCCALIASAVTVSAQGIIFEQTYAEALKKAKSENKLIMIMASATW